MSDGRESAADPCTTPRRPGGRVPALRPRFAGSLAAIATIATAAVAVTAAIAGCAKGPAQEAPGDPERGRLLLRQYGCSACHRIPGVAGPRGEVGPPLEGVASRVYLGGVVPNSPDNMAAWIRNPQQFDPRTVMPNLQVSEQQSRDMVAYLSRLR